MTVNYVAATPTYASDQNQKMSTAEKSGDANSDFMVLLLAGLKNQNPLEPMSNEEFMGQITQMNSLDEAKKMNEKLDLLSTINDSLTSMNENSFSMEMFESMMSSMPQLSESFLMPFASNLIDKVVDITQTDGSVISGMVSGISRDETGMYVTVDGNKHPFESIVGVQ